MLSCILKKVEGSNTVLKEIKEETVTSHSVFIMQVETQMGQISSHLNQRQQGGKGSRRRGFLEKLWQTPKMMLKWVLASCHDVN
ncbi:hypothetical protein MTR67_026232 [Solanum verrucosum]|uniref:Uncharacterized protein n=1 Tax=Solanum verrucosum TaxID=315347 RepID=A0AAF0QYJ0_SOLVR|nr:hypothetical protein MTR67_026232 [Solanum verrucosum]